MKPPSTSTVTEELFTCPACERPVTGRLTLDLEVGALKGKDVSVKAKVTGVQVSHDCTPKTYRQGGVVTATFNGACDE